MLILRTDCEVQPEIKDKLRAEVKNRTGEDCLILDRGFHISKELLIKAASNAICNRNWG